MAPILRFEAVSAGANHTCAITMVNRRAYCWGLNDDGGLGDGTTNRRVTPVPVVGNQAWRQVSVGNLSTCGITTSNIAWCWGRDRHGALGDGPEEQRKLRPVLVAGDHRFTQISAGEFHTCAVNTAKRAWCWGAGFGGMIGERTSLSRYTPRAVAGGHTFDRVSAATNHTCAESTMNDAYCWARTGLARSATGLPGLGLPGRRWWWAGSASSRWTPMAITRAGAARTPWCAAGAITTRDSWVMEQPPIVPSRPWSWGGRPGSLIGVQ